MSNTKELIEQGVRLVRDKKISISAASKQLFPQCTNCSSEDYFRQKLGAALRGTERCKKPKTKQDRKPRPVKVKEEPKPFVLSAWDFTTGKMMGIEDYCAFYNLPIDNVISYKLVSHTGTPYYNILFKDVFQQSQIVSDEFIEATIQKYIQPVYGNFAQVTTCDSDWFDRLIFTDAHIGMDTNKEGIAMYATPWDREEQLRRLDVMVEEVMNNAKGNELYIDDLADFMDGWNGFTTRGGHPLPQNMSNEEAFDIGVEFKMRLIDRLVKGYLKVSLNNICNDNHSGAFGYVVNSAVKKLCEAKYPDIVSVTNYRQFINHYCVGKHAFVITHGKDSKSLKFGFKPKLDAVQIEKIDAYLKQHRIYSKADFIEFGKGDSHQLLFDYCTSDDFAYFNYPAFSPSSEWVQNNFKKGRSGFVIQHVMYSENVKTIIPKFF